MFVMEFLIMMENFNYFMSENKYYLFKIIFLLFCSFNVLI